jgi:TPR repeat protein
VGDACFELGTLYESASGVPRDLARAAALFKQGCDAGQKQACGRAKFR